MKDAKVDVCPSLNLLKEETASWELKMSQKSNIKKPLKQRETIDTEETGIKNPFQLVLARNFSWQSSA
jgi:hypothetical protein